MSIFFIFFIFFSHRDRRRGALNVDSDAVSFFFFFFRLSFRWQSQSDHPPFPHMQLSDDDARFALLVPGSPLASANGKLAMRYQCSGKRCEKEKPQQGSD